MTAPRILLSAALTAALVFAAAPLTAQPTPSTGYQAVLCLKVEAAKTADFHKWISEVIHKLVQSRIDDGTLSRWELYRGIVPQGTDAKCDYVAVNSYPGVPSEPVSGDGLTAELKKAGIPLTSQEYAERRNSVERLVETSIGQTRLSVGSAKVGDYIVVNHMKVIDMDGWINYEKKVWQPMAESMAKDGVRTGWFVIAGVFPFGSSAGDMGITLDVYPTWKAIFSDDDFVGRWHKVHPDMELGTTFEAYDKLRTLEYGHILKLEDVLGK
ncbi:MAG TPA: hypothetical protein VF126_08415 [Acidobacteriaceae bacterium]